MRLIDVAPMLEHLDLEHYDKDYCVSQYNADWIYSWLDSQPTIEAEPVKHGRWVLNKRYGDYECSECEQGDVTALHFRTLKMNYCPNCGAKMTKEET